MSRLDVTARERQLLAHLAEGMSDREISAATHYSEEGVGTALARLYVKLNARNRPNAVHIAWQRGLLGGQP